ncbi:MAG: glycosyl hydrolase [Gemmataceae bacterium]
MIVHSLPFSSGLILICSLFASAGAQEPIAVGKGSYASSPPRGLVKDNQRGVDLVEEVELRKLFLLEDHGQPIPSNKWYQTLLFQQYGTGLWAMPHKVDATREGIEIFYPTSFSGDGVRSLAEFPLVVTGKNFKPIDSRAKSWSDWMVSYRMHEGSNRYLDVSLGEGMPSVWCEFSGVEPRIEFGDRQGQGSRGKKRAKFFALDGKDMALPFKGDTVGILYEGRSYALFAPDNTQFTMDGDGVAVTFEGKSTYLIVSLLPSPSDIELFHKHAFAVPRDTRLSWKYDRPAGKISTTWAIESQPLKGSSRSVLQGWLPHHWRDGTSHFQYLKADYRTIRGTLRLAAGESFTLEYPFHGVLPNLPVPNEKSGYQTERMKKFLSSDFANQRPMQAQDTYNAGKDLQRYTQAALMANTIGDPSYRVIAGKLRRELENWLTYTPGEKSKFFAYYPKRKGLVGFSPSYGSEHFTDHHFHYGYYTFSAAILCSLEPQFASGYGEMAKLLAKEYAHIDRADPRFPRLRTFDAWRGHSFADGNGFPDGNNQESTGEAINSWVGMILLGEALGDAEMTATGVMGYTFETRANVEYWFDPHGDVFPSQYLHKACGMIWCGSIVWGTWFSADPAWIYGIQWLPSGPWMAFYDREPNLIKRAFADVQSERESFETKEAAKRKGASKKLADIKSLGSELGSYHLGFKMHNDPSWVCNQFEQFGKDPQDRFMNNEWIASIYYQAHSLKTLGRVDWSVRSDCPTAMTYFNSDTNTRTYVVWNPSDQPKTITFYSIGKRLGTMQAPSRQISQANLLNP